METQKINKQKSKEFKINYWKIASIILFIILMVQIFMPSKEQVYDFGNGFELKKADLNSLFAQTGNEPITLCKQGSNECIKLHKLGE